MTDKNLLLREDGYPHLPSCGEISKGETMSYKEFREQCAQIAEKMPCFSKDAFRLVRERIAEKIRALPLPEDKTLPHRDDTIPTEQQGLFSKFVVSRTDGTDKFGGKHHGCDYFVLDVTHDQYAKAALSAYAAACEGTHPKLSADMRLRYSLPLPEVKQEHPSTPNTYGGFSASFFVINNRKPSGQEIFSAGRRSGLNTAEALRKENAQLRLHAKRLNWLIQSADNAELLYSRVLSGDIESQILMAIDDALKGGAV